ncbi:MAG: MBL fold metallo-hydrolase [Candidatus Methanodesulfokora sp.]
MRVVPLSSDSMGARSMATFVETKDVRIIIDPGVALGPSRYGLPPHPREWERMQEHWSEIVRHAEKADVLIITHYHYDHHNPWNDLEIYEGKRVLIKDPEKNINYSQRSRASFFLKQLGNRAKIEIADGNKILEGETEIIFSNPVFHGTNNRLGYVIEVLIREGDESFLFTSDVEGPSLEDQVKFVVENKPRTVMIDGPMTYMLGYRYSQASLEASIRNLIRILDIVETLVIDHHLLRDLDWSKRIAEVINKGNTIGKRVLTSNELVNKPLDMLEARRKELYELYPVKESELRKWEIEE